MKYQAITPATDWVYIQLATGQNIKAAVWPVACWALTADKGEVIGLISVPGGGPEDNVMGGTCRLVAPPETSGVYKHISELSEAELEALRTGKLVAEKKP